MTDAIQVPVNTDGDRAMMVEYSRWYPFRYWNAGASWMLQPIYEFWQCYGNRTIEFEGELLDLEKDILLPLLSKQANFWDQLCTPEYYTSLMADHYTHGGWGVFCTDTTMGTIGIIDEMLLYSNDGVIEALPALPYEWSEGSIEGLRARTNAGVDIKWNSETVKITITSDKAQTVKVSVYGGEEQNVTFNEGDTKTIVLAR